MLKWIDRIAEVSLKEVEGRKYANCGSALRSRAELRNRGRIGKYKEQVLKPESIKELHETY